jgi:hypothetical protein
MTKSRNTITKEIQAINSKLHEKTKNMSYEELSSFITKETASLDKYQDLKSCSKIDKK